MNLRQDLIWLIIHRQSELTEEQLLDAMLDLLTERADEWEDLAMAIDLPGNMAPAMLAVLRDPGEQP